MLCDLCGNFGLNVEVREEKRCAVACGFVDPFDEEGNVYATLRRTFTVDVYSRIGGAAPSVVGSCESIWEATYETPELVGCDEICESEPARTHVSDDCPDVDCYTSDPDVECVYDPTAPTSASYSDEYLDQVLFSDVESAIASASWEEVSSSEGKLLWEEDTDLGTKTYLGSAGPAQSVAAGGAIEKSVVGLTIYEQRCVITLTRAGGVVCPLIVTTEEDDGDTVTETDHYFSPTAPQLVITFPPAGENGIAVGVTAARVGVL